MDDDADPQQQKDSEEKPNSIVVILVGAPGSGKTTFCNDVVTAARRRWARVCQDTIANGKAGTKSQCLKTAADALKEGKSVFIDRCNLEREQRSEFVKLGGEQIDVHAVVLDLPARVCISRSVKRTGHEGNLQGGKAAAVVNRMLQKKELPKLNEGFSRITFCRIEGDISDVVKTYSSLGPSDRLPSGIFGQKNPDAKVQLGIMKFLKKVETPKNVSDGNYKRSEGNGSQDSAPKQENKDSALKQDNKEKDPCSMEIESGHEGKDETKHTDLLEKSLPDDAHLNNVPILAFPSISTSDFQFDHGKASDIIVESVAEFLNKVNNVRLVLVDLSHKSHILSLVKAKAAKKNIDPNKFSTFVGNITRLCTEGNLRCSVIANAANWRLKPGGGGINAAIFKAAGEELETATKEKADSLNPGSSVAVPLPSTSPLYQKEGVAHIIHVLGPNMNPQRPNCLKDDYVNGCKVLRDAYASLFQNFASIVRGQRCTMGKDGDPINNVSEGSSNSHSHSDQKNKREGSHESESNKKSKSDEKIVLDKEKQKSEKIAAKRTWGSWAQALHQTAMHPEKHKDGIIEISEDFIVLNDLYAKAKKHILVLSRLPGLDGLADVRKEHLPLLKTMHSAGLKWAEKFLHEDASLIFRLGYHSVPSMRQLHLHVISQDFDSPHLKNKKHWNSFNTPFFRDSADVIEEVGESGEATLKDEKLMSMELRCHRCRSAHPNIPRLRSHIANCKASFPSTLLQNGRLIYASPYASIQAILFGPYLLAGLTSTDWDINAGNSTTLSDWITPVPSFCRSQLVSISQQSSDQTFFLSNLNSSLTMDQQPKAGTDDAIHATFRLIPQDPKRSNSRLQKNSIGRSVMLEPFDLPGMVIVHQGPNNALKVSSSTSTESIFKVVAGLDGKPNSLSFESSDHQGCFIYSDGTDVKLECQGSGGGGAGFGEQVSYAMGRGMREYHPISFAVKGVRRNFVLEPLLSLRDESYTVYFNIVT